MFHIVMGTVALIMVQIVPHVDKLNLYKTCIVPYINEFDNLNYKIYVYSIKNTYVNNFKFIKYIELV